MSKVAKSRLEKIRELLTDIEQGIRECKLRLKGVKRARIEKK